jgi:hypothetical protein
VLHSPRTHRLDDNRWDGLTGLYKSPFDPRPLLAKLETESDTAMVWDELWEELHHQGDVGDASYASVPHIVRIYRQRGVVDWNTYAIVAIIDLARTKGNNPRGGRIISQLSQTGHSASRSGLRCAPESVELRLATAK